MIRTLALTAGLAVAGTAQAGFVGGGVVTQEAWNSAATATLGAALGGQTITVFRFYAAFDGQSLTDDTVNSVFGANISWASGGGVNISGSFPDSSDFFQNAAIRWDSMVTINIDDLPQGAVAAADGDGINWHPLPSSGTGKNALTGGWFVSGTTQGQAGTNAGSNDFGTGLFLVLLAQISVVGDFARLTGDMVDIQTDGSFGDLGGFFSGSLNLGINNPDNSSIQNIMVPTPGAVALFGLAGLTAARRRRA